MSFIPSKVNIGNIIINNADHFSSVSYGSTSKIDRNVVAKKSQGFGQQLSDHTVVASSFKIMLDDDFLDVYSEMKSM
ncbi:hypothetical protein [Peribacillus glennii]|uniref:Spore germination protein n=1 Tax=Peribacillus glennii TaxID=2303991 RepID=A0A372L7B1_9BACI|nr:hypothetical protein [Peribacillus glennii]RFU60561.1 hypothetical protein D0466_21320 [Peribacillus glennii]